MAGAESGEKGPRRCFSFSRRSSHAARLCALAHGRQRARLFAARRRDRFPPQSVQVVGVSAGGYHSAAVTADGRVFSWGLGRDGQLGHGDTEDQLTPKLITALAGHRIVHVDGSYHSIMVTASGRVFSCGFNSRGQLGSGDTEDCSVPTEVAVPSAQA